MTEAPVTARRVNLEECWLYTFELRAHCYLLPAKCHEDAVAYGLYQYRLVQQGDLAISHRCTVYCRSRSGEGEEQLVSIRPLALSTLA